MLAAHEAPAFGKLHAAPHAPQFAALLDVFVSHPFVGSPSQSAKGALHARIVHAPAMHAAAACAKEHVVAHVPQCSTLLDVFVSQPFAGLPSQSPKPALHAPRTQAPPLHDALALGNAQAWPQIPQFAALVPRSVSQPFAALPSQSPCPAGHIPTAHVPPLQIAPVAVHACPQLPQLDGFTARSTSHPFAALPSQSA